MTDNAVIAVAGCGRIGLAVSILLHYIGIDRHNVDLVLIDSDNDNLIRADQRLKPYTGFKAKLYRHNGNSHRLAKYLEKNDVTAIICATPFTENLELAQIAQKIKIHYIDFTESFSITSAIAKLADKSSNIVFAPQCGLAPGLINVLGLELARRLKKCTDLKMRVGALSQTAWSPGFYSITWSPEGLINEYKSDAWAIRNGKIVQVKSMTDLEEIIADGIKYECFSTSGGIGMPGIYKGIKNVDYKTIRYPGHHAFVSKEFDLNDFEGSVNKAKKVFKKTRKDLVIAIAHASDNHGNSEDVTLIYKPDDFLNLTALELTTAAGGIAVLDLILNNLVEPGLATAASFRYSDFWDTNVMKYVENTRTRKENSSREEE